MPDEHKIATYDALRRYFEGALDVYYTEKVEADPRYDSGIASEVTECVGFEVTDEGLYVVMAIEDWADLQEFVVDLPGLSRDAHTDDGTVLTLAAGKPKGEEPRDA